MPETRQKIVIHAGFHKTGTTTVQAFLRANGPILWPVMAIGLRWQLRDVRAAARAFSSWRDPFSLARFGHRFGDYLQGLNLAPGRKLCLSSEELAGHIPGHEHLVDYSATPQLMREIADVAQARFRDRLDLTFYFSTRAAADWIDSAYWERVKTARMVMDLEEFRARYRHAGDLAPIVEAVRARVAPHPVVSTALEDTRDLALGPATPLVDLLDLTPARRAALKPHRTENARRSDEILHACLKINRSPRSDSDVRAAKMAILNPPDSA